MSASNEGNAEEQLCISAVRLLLRHTLPSNLKWISNPEFKIQFHHESLEPAHVACSFHARAHADSLLLEPAIKLLDLASFMAKLLLSDFSSFEIQERNLLGARVMVQTSNQHVRLPFSEPGAIAIAKFTQVEGADIVRKSSQSKRGFAF